MAQEVGVAYVTLLPSGRGFGKSVEGQVDDALGRSEKKTNGFFSKVGTGIKRVALGVAGVATGVAALAVGGGISRALNIEDAQAKLKGLGHDTKSVETIMNDALASVKGTAFGLDAAATTAASAVASGIKPGQELEKYLRLTADAATIAGVSMEEMGSIINKVQAKGKAQMEDLNRLTERGIPIMQMLADEYGVTAEEMSDMVSRGEVDAERFRKALENNVGGAALESGNTTRGAFANMMAALSRLGLVFVGPALDHAKTFFNEVTTIFDGLGERLGPWVERVNERLSEMFNPEGLGDGFLDWFDGMVDAIQSGPIPQLLDALAPVLPAIADAAFQIGTALGDAFFQLGEKLGPVLPLLAEDLATAVIDLAPVVADLVEALLPLVPPIADLLAKVAPLASDIVEFLIPALEGLAGVIEDRSFAIGLVFDFADGGLEATEQRLLEDTGELGVQARGAFLSGFAIGTIQWELENGAQLVHQALAQIVFSIGQEMTAAQGVVQQALGSILGAVVGNVAQVRASIELGLASIRQWWEQTWNSLVGAVSGAWGRVVSGVVGGIATTISHIRALPGQIASAMAGASTWLVQAGRDLIQGLINGVGQMVGNAVAAVQSVGGQMLAGVKATLGIKSPSRVFRDEVGKMVGLGLLEGIEDRAIAGRIDTAVNHMVSVPDTIAAPGGIGTLVDSITINGAQSDRIIQDLMFELRARARGGVYAR